jgi:hypothetical protein
MLHAPPKQDTARWTTAQDVYARLLLRVVSAETGISCNQGTEQSGEKNPGSGNNVLISILQFGNFFGVILKIGFLKVDFTLVCTEVKT